MCPVDCADRLGYASVVVWVGWSPRRSERRLRAPPRSRRGSGASPGTALGSLWVHVVVKVLRGGLWPEGVAKCLCYFPGRLFVCVCACVCDVLYLGGVSVSVFLTISG